jgi:hypothetical protein
MRSESPKNYHMSDAEVERLHAFVIGLISTANQRSATETQQ